MWVRAGISLSRGLLSATLAGLALLFTTGLGPDADVGYGLVAPGNTVKFVAGSSDAFVSIVGPTALPTATPLVTHTPTPVPPSHTPTQTSTPTITASPSRTPQSPTPFPTPTRRGTLVPPTKTRTVTPTATVPTATRTPCAGWSRVASPNVHGLNRLQGVSALSESDVWAVGYTSTGVGSQTLIMRWDGAQWSLVPSPNPSSDDNVLEAVSARAPNDVWAVGYMGTAPFYSTLVMRWNGQAWSVIPSPNPNSNNVLYGVTASGPNDAWAVGAQDDQFVQSTLILRWDGLEWKEVAGPNPGEVFNLLRGVDAVADNDVWAVGYLRNAEGSIWTLTLHWDGSQWSVVPSPNVGPNANLLYGVSALAPNDAWAVGFSGAFPNRETLTMRWDGTQWSVVPSPNRSGDQNVLTSVSSASSGEAWAVGWYGQFPNVTTIIEHWNGSQWSLVESPNPGQYNQLLGVAAFPSGRAWAVGDTGNESATSSLTVRYVGCATTTPTRTATPTPACPGAWGVVESPNPGSQNYLSGVAAVSPTDVWAAGSLSMNVNSPSQTMILHWDGSQWTRVPSPNRGTGDNYLTAVTAISYNDVWAVGWAYDPSIGRWLTLTEHWDGAQWSIVPSPNQFSVQNYLYGVSAVASNDVWAVGEYSGLSAPQTLTMHWDGTQWSIVPSPNVGTDNNRLNAVFALSANDVWAVGSAGVFPFLTLIQHWDGSEWEVVPSPNPPGSNNNSLRDVVAISPDDAWAVGSYQSVAGVSGTLVEHWDGQEWSIVPSPNGGSRFNTLHGITALASNDIWAAGDFSGPPSGTLIEHWDGIQWSIVPSPNPGKGIHRLNAIASVSSTDVWAVGDSHFRITLTMRYTPQCPSPTPSPTATASPSSTFTPTSPPSVTPFPTATLSPGSTPSIIASATAPPVTTPATPCPLTFTDVAPEHTFYQHVRCLACRGIVSGYADGTFRPENPVTRGQLAKVVSGAAGLTTEPGQPMYEDVPQQHTFYLWINRLSRRGVMSGYPCGGSGEPCGIQSLPYFRPGAEATRGQTAKIVANAALLTGDPTAQTFEDVPLTHPFYVWIERLAQRNVMSGYPCGGEGEPCVPPQNRPYFRPHNNVTRGQSAKIVANTFFPGCGE